MACAYCNFTDKVRTESDSFVDCPICSGGACSNEERERAQAMVDNTCDVCKGRRRITQLSGEGDEPCYACT